MESALMTGIVTTAFAALLGGVGWIINSQNRTNQSLSQGITDLSKGITEVVGEFKAAMSLIEERSQNQKTLCQMYRDTINNSHKDLKIQVGKIENKVNHQNHNQL